MSWWGRKDCQVTGHTANYENEQAKDDSVAGLASKVLSNVIDDLSTDIRTVSNVERRLHPTHSLSPNVGVLAAEQCGVKNLGIDWWKTLTSRLVSAPGNFSSTRF